MSYSNDYSPHTADPEIPEKKVAVDINAEDGDRELQDVELETDSNKIAIGHLREADDLRQGLHQRHIQMISLAGTIGTGLFLGSGKALASAGPLGCFLGYVFIGFFAMSVCFNVGESMLPL